jgi:hypothetical protein
MFFRGLLIFPGLHRILSQKAELFMVTAVRPSNPTPIAFLEGSLLRKHLDLRGIKT